MRLNWLGKATAAAGALYVAGKLVEQVSQPEETPDGVVRPCPHCRESLRIRTTGAKTCPECGGDFSVDSDGNVSVFSAPPPAPKAPATATQVDHTADCPYCGMNLQFSGFGEKCCAGCERPFFHSSDGETRAFTEYTGGRQPRGFLAPILRQEPSRFSSCTRLIVALEDGEQAMHVLHGALDRARREEGRVELFSHAVERDPYGVVLFGFPSALEVMVFRRLLEIDSVGPATLLELFGALSMPDLREVVRGGDVARLRGVPGVGAKTAERILRALRGWLPHQKG